MASVKCSCMHTTEIQWYIVVCYDKLSVQQCLCATELNLKGGFCRNPRNPSRSATGSTILALAGADLGFIKGGGANSRY